MMYPARGGLDWVKWGGVIWSQGGLHRPQYNILPTSIRRFVCVQTVSQTVECVTNLGIAADLIPWADRSAVHTRRRFEILPLYARRPLICESMVVIWWSMTVCNRILSLKTSSLIIRWLFHPTISLYQHFYSASALLAMQSTVLARGILSVTLNDLERRNDHYFALFRGIR